MNEQGLLAEGERLILAAFAAARDKGVTDWRRMTSAVLKNRLLALTNREFTEQRWHATTFQDFLAQYPDLLVVDAIRHPPLVELLRDPDSTAFPTEQGRAVTARHRIRPDLWRAVLDYSSSNGYVWDETEVAAAAVAVPNEDPRVTLPTVDELTYASWRDKFAQDWTPRVSAQQAEAIERWRGQGLATTQLPATVRGPWNAALKHHVIETLESWFETHHLAVPDDLVGTEHQSTRAYSASTESLRDLVLGVVAVMTRQELEALRLPPTAVLRITR